MLPNLIVGPIAFAAGVLIVIFRRQRRDMTVNAEKTALGEKAGRAVGRLQTSLWVGVAGVVGVFVGVMMIVGGIVVLVSSGR